MNYCSVFIFRVGSLGDSIVALPAIKKLNNYYNDKFYLITNMPKNMIFPVWGCYKHTNYFKDYFEFEYSFKSFIKLRQFIRQKKGQKILYYFVDKSSFKRNFRNYLLFKILGFAIVYGWKECIGDYIERDFNGKLETVQPEYERLGEIVDKCLEVEGTTNYSFDYIKFNDRSISSTLAKFSFIENNFLVLGVGGKTNIQRWDVYNYVEVLSALHNDIYVIILGGREEYKNANEIKEQLPNKQILNLCTKTSILESAYILSKSLLYFGNDTGTAHLAGIVGTRCLVVTSGRNNLGKWDPYGDKHTIIRKRTDCEGCFLSISCEHDVKCMNKIALQDVKKILTKTLLTR